MISVKQMGGTLIPTSWGEKKEGVKYVGSANLFWPDPVEYHKMIPANAYDIRREMLALDSISLARDRMIYTGSLFYGDYGRFAISRNGMVYIAQEHANGLRIEDTLTGYKGAALTPFSTIALNAAGTSVVVNPGEGETTVTTSNSVYPVAWMNGFSNYFACKGSAGLATYFISPVGMITKLGESGTAVQTGNGTTGEMVLSPDKRFIATLSTTAASGVNVFMMGDDGYFEYKSSFNQSNTQACACFLQDENRTWLIVASTYSTSSGKITVFNVSDTGALALVNPNQVGYAALQLPYSIEVSEDHKTLFVGKTAGSPIGVFNLDAETGSVTAIASPAERWPDLACVSLCKANGFLYALTRNSIWQFVQEEKEYYFSPPQSLDEKHGDFFPLKDVTSGGYGLSLRTGTADASNRILLLKPLNDAIKPGEEASI